MSDWHNQTQTGTRYLANQGKLTRLVRRCRLRVLSGPDQGKESLFSQAVISLGSRTDCDLTLQDPAVSGHHLEFCLQPDGIVVRDMGSTNGTWSGTLRIREVLVHQPVELTIGDSQIEFTPLPEEAAQELALRDHLGDMLGSSPAMCEIYDLVKRAGPTGATVLISGETGTGKELLAETLHAASNRTGPLVVVDCTALPLSLAESELFGHERGAFTGAVASHRGAFERAAGGTLFLDEIADLDPALQPKLLRALEQRRVQRIGAEAPREIDVRVIAASRRELAEEVRRGGFRDDLYYRLAVIRMRMPALRERKQDITLLAAHFIQHFLDGQEPVDWSSHISPQVMDRLLAHDWPGNVRELRNAVERAMVLQVDPLAESQQPPQSASSTPAANESLPFSVAKKQAIERFENDYLTTLLAAHQNNISRAARAAGMERRNFQRLLRRHKMSGKDEATRD